MVFAQHHWPVWGNARLLDYLAKQRDTYKYLHDQTLRLMNHGPEGGRDRRAAGAAEELWRTSGTCAATTARSATTPRRSTSATSAGTTPIRPTSIRCRRSSARKKLVAYMGGADAVIARAREDFAKGEYRWVADAMSQVVFAEPDNTAARELAADAHGADRLSGGVGHLAQRLSVRRAGAAQRQFRAGDARPRRRRHRARASASTCSSISSACASTATRPRARRIVVNWAFPDVGERYALTLQNCALTYLADRHADAADATVTLDRTTLNRIILRELALPEAIAQGLVKIEGNPMKVAELFGLLDDFTMGFDVIEPLRNDLPLPA